MVGMNYYTDSRVLSKERRWWVRIDNLRALLNDYFGVEERWVPIHFEVCPTCKGRGHYVNPSIDCDGLTGEDFADDPDLAEGYFAGHYDVPCDHCNGQRVIPVPDNENDLAEVNGHIDAMISIQMEYDAERRAGA